MTLPARSHRYRMLQLPLACTFVLPMACDSKGSGIDTANDEISLESAVPVALDSLPVWTSTLALTIGHEPRNGQEFLMPDPLGADDSGRVYVIDPRPQEIRRFDPAGRFEDVVVRPGQGPGEMRFFPLTYGFTQGFLWYSESQTGVVHFVSADGDDPFTQETGLTGAAFGVRTIEITPERGGQSYLVRAELYEAPVYGLRPTSHVQYFRARGQKLDTLLHYRTPSSFLSLDEGRTSIRYLGPLDHTVALYDQESGQFLRIDRPVRQGARYASVVLQWLTGSGVVIRARELLIPAAPLQAAERDSIESALLVAASFDGRRTVAAELQRDLARLVAAIPDRYPAFDEAVLGWEGTIWLRLQPADRQLSHQTWLVLDHSFNPIAQAQTPSNVFKMVFRDDNAWWATMRGAHDVFYVGRVDFDAPALR